MQISHIARVFKNPAVLLPSFFAILMQMILHGTVYSFTSTIAENLGASKFQIGINTTLFTVVQVAAAGWVGRILVKKIGTTRSVMLGFACMAAACVMEAFAPNIWVLYAAQVICGTGNLLLFSVLAALAIRYVPQENQSTAMGLFQALYGIGMTIGPVMVGNIASASSYQTAYLVFAAISAVAVPLAAVSLSWMRRKKEAVHD